MFGGHGEHDAKEQQKLMALLRKMLGDGGTETPAPALKEQRRDAGERSD
jgi:hypothetical protein